MCFSSSGRLVLPSPKRLDFFINSNAFGERLSPSYFHWGRYLFWNFFLFFSIFLFFWSPGPLIPLCPGHLVPLHLVPSLSGPQCPGPLVLVPWSSVLFRSFFSNLSFTLFYYQFYIFTLSCVCWFSFLCYFYVAEVFKRFSELISFIFFVVCFLCFLSALFYLFSCFSCLMYFCFLFRLLSLLFAFFVLF